MNRSLLPGLLLIAFFQTSLSAQTGAASDFIRDSLDAFVEAGMRDWQIPGLALAIIDDGEVIVSRGYGTTSMDGGGRPVDAHTLFMIGSNTKAFTATTLAMLAAGSDFALTEPVRTYLPYFDLQDSLAAARTTTEDLLSHRIGLGTFQGDFTYWASDLSRREVVERMARLEPQYDFRTGWGYCNAGYTAAGEVIAALTGAGWAQTVRDSILRPLGMDRTVMLPDELRRAENAATPHSIVDGSLVTVDVAAIDNLAPAGSMSSSATDMARWVVAQLQSPTPAMQRARQPASTMGIDTRPDRPTHFHLYGLGWMITDLDGQLQYAHTGGINGFVSSVTFLPEAGIGVIVLTNTDQNGFFQSLGADLVDRLLGLPDRRLSARSLSGYRQQLQRDSSRKADYRDRLAGAAGPELPLAAFAGSYHNPVYDSVRIEVREEGLVLRFGHHPDLSARLDYLEDSTFLATFSDPIYGQEEIPFELADGAVTGFVLRVADFIEPYPYPFTRLR